MFHFIAVPQVPRNLFAPPPLGVIAGRGLVPTFINVAHITAIEEDANQRARIFVTNRMSFNDGGSGGEHPTTVNLTVEEVMQAIRDSQELAETV